MKDLTKGNIYKTFILFAIPLVLSGILSQAYNIIDTVIAGKYLGSDGLAAVGATSAFITFISAILWGYGSGFALYVAKLFGGREYFKIKECIYTNYIVMTAVTIVISLVTILFGEVLLNALNVDSTIREEALRYFVVYMAGLFLLNLNWSSVYILQAFGSSAYPFWMSVLSSVLNVSGNIFTVTVLEMGAAGLAVSTVFAALVVNVFYMLKLRACFKEMQIKRHAKFSINAVLAAITYSVPTMLQQMIMYASGMFIAPIVNKIGSSATAAYTVIMKIYDINAGVYQNSAKTVSNYTAQCLGAGKLGKIKKGLFVGFIQGTVLLLPVLLVCVFWAKPICAMFFPEGYAGEGLNLAVIFVEIYMPFILINIINNLYHGFFRAVKSVKLLILSTLVGSAARYAFTMWLAGAYGMHGVYMGWVISWAVEAVYVLWLYFAGKWKSGIKHEIAVYNANNDIKI